MAATVPAIDARQATLALLSARATAATVCPSEVARMLAAAADDGDVEPDWRSKMPAVHAAVDRLVLEGRIYLSWKGQTLPSRCGPYRIGRCVRE